MRAVTPIIVALLALVDVVFGGVSHILNLERAFPANSVELSHLRARDKARHGRRLNSVDGVVDFPVDGSYNIGLYYTRLQLGSPPKEFYVQIDSGSDALWVSCTGCNGCPQRSDLNILLSFYDLRSSTTASSISCTDQKCHLAMQYSGSSCSTETSQCSYKFQYGDGTSRTSGYYVQDLLKLTRIDTGSVISNTSASIVFGCSTLQTGELATDGSSVDGIFGFGQQDLSVISQLASAGLAPRAFSHCLKGSDGGGGILVLGEINEPNMVYSPLVPSQLHYNLNLRSVSVNGKTLPIDPAVFATSDNPGTIIDSGTTFAYLPEDAYDIFVNAISNAVAQSTRPVSTDGYICYTISGRVDAIFPPVSFNFVGNASMVLRPEGYLLQQSRSGGDSQVWCIGFLKVQGQGITVLGDIVLKDKIVVYDLAGQRIGWTDYDCSSPVNVSTSSPVNVSTTSTRQGEYVTVPPTSKGNSLQTAPFTLTATSILILLMGTFTSAWLPVHTELIYRKE